MKSIRIILIALCCVGLLTACSSKPEPIEVAEQFWQAMEQGDLEQAKRFSTPDSEKSVAWQANREVRDVALGVLRYGDEEDQALVATSLFAGSEDHATSLQFDTVLVQYEGQWRVDFNETVGSMIAVSLDEFGTVLKESVDEMGSALGDAVNEAMEQAAQGLSEALQQAAEEMRKATEALRKEREQREQQEQQRHDESAAEKST